MRAWTPVLLAPLFVGCSDPADHAPQDEGYCPVDVWHQTWTEAVSELRSTELPCTDDGECTIGAMEAVGRCGTYGSCGVVMHVERARAWDPERVGAEMCQGAPRDLDVVCDVSPSCAALTPVCRASRCVPLAD